MKHDCRETLERLELYLDREILSPEEIAHIRRHLEECPPCDGRRRTQERLHEILLRLRDKDPCPHALKDRVRALLEEG
ncbi:MAG TPA: zf-HC2 domain-containing protein [Actinomycetota bacterium]|jgi:mycothiol system anti-sigma-R factor|nr:zf-HC2 domain-containing protein [Actinomycetota bacterium]